MNTHLISYDLRIPETSEDYKKLISYIKSFDSWATPLKSVWFIKTSKSVSIVRDELKLQTDLNDGLIVLDVTNDDWATYGISKTVIDWMKVDL